MSIAPIAGTIAGVSAIIAYIDAKYHISKDIKTYRAQTAAEHVLQRNARGRGPSLWYQFETSALRFPHEEAIWSRTVCYTWAETHANACRYAQFFLRQGVKPGDLVAVYLKNRPEFLFVTLGLWALGAAPAWVNVNLGGEGLVHCLGIAGGSLAFVDGDEECVRRFGEVKERIEKQLGMSFLVLDEALKGDILRLEPLRPDDELRSSVAPKSPMFIFYTSGTTGMPKACPLETRRAATLVGRPQSIGLRSGPDGDRWYVCMPMYHGTGGTTALACMLTGLTCCIGTKFSTSRFWSDVRDSRSTAIVYVGETARYLLNAPPSELDKKHNVRAMYGNGLRPDVWQRFVDRFGIESVGEFFNSTEGVISLCNHSKGSFTAAAVGHHGLIDRWRFRNTYVPVEIDVVTGNLVRDPHTGFCKRKPMDEGSEILVQMPSEDTFAGYWNNPEATKARFERDVFNKGDLWYRTGDALRRDNEGRWYFLDRLGDTFRWKSENVSTAEVSEAFGGFPGIQETNVYGVEVPGHDGRAGCAAIYVDPTQRDNFDFDGLLAHATAKLPKYAVPVFLRVQKHQTTMHNNKQNKVPLRNDGIDLRKIKQRADEEAQRPGQEDAKYDILYWWPAALRSGKEAASDKSGYVVFTLEDWDALRSSDNKYVTAKL